MYLNRWISPIRFRFDLDYKSILYIVGELQAFCLMNAERDVVVELGHFSTEEDAYEKLFETIKKWDEDYKNNK